MSSQRVASLPLTFALLAALSPTSLIALSMQQFIRADADASTTVDISDAVFTLNFLFVGGVKPDCADAADANDDGAIDIADAVATLGFLFLGNPAPPAPFPGPGSDPTLDELGCRACDPGDCFVVESTLIVDDETSFRNGSPSIALDAIGLPFVAFPDGSFASFARVDATSGEWLVEAMRDEEDMPIQGLWLDVALDSTSGDLVVLTHRGPGLEFWREADAGQWRAIAGDASAGCGDHDAIAIADDGSIRAGLRQRSAEQPTRAATVSEGSLESIGLSGQGEDMTFALTPWNEPRLAQWEADDDRGWVLRLASPESVTDVLELGSHSLEQGDIRLLVTGNSAPGRTHVLAARSTGLEQLELVIASGAPGEGWAFTPVALSDSIFSSPSFCFEAPPVDGARCSIDYTEHAALGVFESPDDRVYFLYSRTRRTGNVVARCEDESIFNCSIDDETRMDGDLRLAWFQDGVLEERVIASGIAAQRADAVLDAGQNLHVVCYDLAIGPNALRYLRIDLAMILN